MLQGTIERNIRKWEAFVIRLKADVGFGLNENVHFV